MPWQSSFSLASSNPAAVVIPPETRTPRPDGRPAQKIVKLIKKQSVDERGNDDSRQQDQWPGHGRQDQSQFNEKEASRAKHKMGKKKSRRGGGADNQVM